MSNGFQRVPSHIRSIAGTEVEKGRLFERLMKAYFRQDPLYGDRFSDVWLRHPPRTSVRTAPVTIAVETTVEPMFQDDSHGRSSVRSPNSLPARRPPTRKSTCCAAWHARH